MTAILTMLAWGFANPSDATCSDPFAARSSDQIQAPDGYTYEGKKLGEGKAFRVYLIKDVVTDELFAWKVLKNPAKKYEVRRQVRLAKQWEEYGFFEGTAFSIEDDASLVMTYFDGGTLKDLMRRESEFLVQEDHPAHQALISYLDLVVQHRIIFRDTHPANIAFARDSARFNIIDSFGKVELRASDIPDALYRSLHPKNFHSKNQTLLKRYDQFFKSYFSR